MVLPIMLPAMFSSRSTSAGLARPVLEAVEHALEPAGALAARRALAARLVVEEAARASSSAHTMQVESSITMMPAEPRNEPAFCTESMSIGDVDLVAA